MATKYKERLFKFKCSVCGSDNYYSTKNKKLLKDKLVRKKHCPKCKKHTTHNEAKI